MAFLSLLSLQRYNKFLNHIILFTISLYQEQEFEVILQIEIYSQKMKILF